jgi:hypothetical protein
MARKIKRLNARTAATIAKYGRHAGGGGCLYRCLANDRLRKVLPSQSVPLG